MVSARRNGTSFFQISSSGSVVPWGTFSTPPEVLKDVRCIQEATSAHAAIRHDGTVVCWGDPEQGGDSRSVQSQLEGVVNIQACSGAFAAIRADGTVITWGGGDSTDVQEELKHVVQIQSGAKGFAAI